MEKEEPEFVEDKPRAMVELDEPPALPPTDPRRLIWSWIANAAMLPGPAGERVGEATSIVTPWPHQTRAFERLYSSWPPKLLIADEVGLGKTIEAGLLLRQAWLSGKAKRILILAPKAVLTQWQIELREKFNMNWPIYDGSPALVPVAASMASSSGSRGGLAQGTVRYRFEPIDASSRSRGGAGDDAEPWDLIILDEAHHARRKGAGLTKDRAQPALSGSCSG